MLTTYNKYTVSPKVYPVGKPCEVCLLPAARSFLFFSDVNYIVMVSGVNGDDPWYHAPSAWTRFDLHGEGGVLRFTYTFESEQEYQIRIYRGSIEKANQLVDLAVYALEEDLYTRMPLRGDLHSHTFRSDGECDPAELFGVYREMGYDFQVLTDHNRYYPNAEIEKVYEGMKLGICHIKGEEVHTPTSTVHIVHAGGKQSVAEIYFKDPDRYERELAECRTRVPAEIPEGQRERYAQALWSTERIHEVDGLAIFAHPFWRPGSNHCYNVCESLTRSFLSSGMFDAFELVGGMHTDGINRAVALWQELRCEGHRIPVVGSSDVHRLATLDFPYHFTICFAARNERDAILQSVREGMSVAVELTGREEEQEYRAYGDFRLVTYAQFLLKNFFPEWQRICHGEGVAMRRYAMGMTPAATLEALVAQSADFRDTFFGKKAPVVPDNEMIALEDAWRAVHVNGPQSKGSLAFLDPPTRQL